MVLRRALVLASLGLMTTAFSPAPTIGSSRSISSTPSSSQLYGGSSGYASSLTGKKETVEKVKGLLDSSDMIFTIPAGSMTVAQQQELSQSMPSGTTVKVVKNKLMARAVEGTEYATAVDFLKGPNMWFFIEDDIKGTMTAYKEFLKSAQKRETHPILGGVLEGRSYDAAGVDAIGQLPSKQDLYAKIAASIKAVPTKVARVIKEPGNKMARAIKLATMPEDKD
jgi:large subunit ribosomal protein L10